MALILLRHGEPEVSRGVCYGQSDITAHIPGQDELEQLLSRLNRPVARLHTSPLRRCRELAEELAPMLGLEAEADPRLCEIDFGRWEMKRWDDIPRAEIDLWALDIEGARPHGGECVAQLVQRVGIYLTEIANDQGDVLAVSHLGVARAMAAALGHADPYELKLDFGDLLTFETDHIA